MKYFYLIFLLFLAVGSQRVNAQSNDEASVGVTWVSNGSSTSVRQGVPLSREQCPNGYCEGFYYLKVSHKHSGKEKLAAFIPAIGGSNRIVVDDEVLEVKSDYSSVGPVVLLDKLKDRNEIKIFISAPLTNFTGVWKSSLMVSDYSELLSIQREQIFTQIYTPMLNFAVLLVFSALFFLIFHVLKKKNKIYRNFSIALFLWSGFYFFLSGIPRELNFKWGSVLHYPVRELSLIGLFLIFLRIPRKKPFPVYRAIVAMLMITVVSVIMGLAGFPYEQRVLHAIVSTLPFFLLFPSQLILRDLTSKLLFSFGILCLLGQISDSIKLLEVYGFHYSVPFLNRWTFPPLLIAAFADCIIQFSGSFHHLRAHLFKAKAYARTILNLAEDGLSHDTINYLLKVVARICGFNRVSLAQRQQDGSYRIVKLYGSDFSAEGSLIEKEKIPEIEQSIAWGEIVFGTVQKVNIGWKTSSFTSVPVPAVKNPPYLLLLSDPKKINLNTEDIIPYLSQISSAIWTNLERTKEQNLRIQTEQKFGSLVKQLDPHLYEFISNNLNRLDEQHQLVSDTRGIVFFDQKSYSTMTENFDDATMAKFAKCVGDWVAASTVRYGARISNFSGDAYLLEVFGIGSESEESIALRTLKLVWSLADTLGDLNRILLKEGFNPITFRFGAHIGRVTSANLDFIHKGLSNSIGDTVNVAARLQTLAKVGTICISGELSNYAKGKFVLAEIPKQYVKGRSKMIEIYSMVGVVENSTDSEGVVA